MAKETGGIPGSGASTWRYPPSWLDRLFDFIRRLPGPTWVAYVLLLVPSIFVATSALWLSGLRPWGEMDPAQIFWGTSTVGVLAAMHRLRIVAGSSFDVFRPALGDGVPDPEAIRYELTVMPARSILLITLFGFVITPLYYLADPVASQVVGLNGLGLIARALSEGFTTVVVLAILYQAIRQARRVTRLHAVAEHVDPFRAAPLYAFSRLTAQTGVVLIMFNALGLILNPTITTENALALYLPWMAAFLGGTIAIFVVPLLGMHRRLADLKDGLEDAVDGRMRILLGELNEAIDDRATDRADGLDRMVSALRHEREVLVKLPTWPWSTATLRGFGSALLLPIGLFLVQRYLGEFLG